MPFLLDTNCWMQIIRSRENAASVHALLVSVPPEDIRLTDFSLYSIALVMRRHKILDQFPMFIQQIGIGQSVQIVRIEPSELSKVVEVCETHRLDFDDGYQYVAAELNDLRLVSFDADFDRTPRGRLTAAAALRLFTDEQKNELQA